MLPELWAHPTQRVNKLVQPGSTEITSCCIVQIEHPDWTNVFDSDPELAKRARQYMLQELAKPATVGIGTHFANAVMGRVTLAQGKYQWHMHQ